MDALILEKKLDSLHRCLKRVEQKSPEDSQILAHDPDLQDILVLNLSRAVQLCVDMGAHILADHNAPPPNTMGETFDLLARENMIPASLAENLKKSVGFRNIAVHNYDALDWQIVHAIATRHLSDFNAFAKAISQYL